MNMSQGHCNENCYNLEYYFYVTEPLVAFDYRYLRVYCTSNALTVMGIPIRDMTGTTLEAQKCWKIFI